MVAQTQVVRFQKDSSGTNGVTQDVNLNFTPKAIIVYSDCGTANDTVSAHYQWSQGFSDGTNHACVTSTSDDADNSADTEVVHTNDSVYVRMNETNNANVVERATVAFSTNKVTFTWVVNSTAATYIHMKAFGGSDITNVKVNTVQNGATGTGTKDYTGLGFDPTDTNSVLFTVNADFSTVGNTPAAFATCSFGCAVSSSKQWCVSNVMEDSADPSDTWRYYTNSKCLICLDSTTGSVDYIAGFDSWITDGFRLNYTDAPSDSTFFFSYLVIKGGTWDAGTFLSDGNVGVNNYSVSVSSKTIRGLLIASADVTNSPSDNIDIVGTYALSSIGATDGTNQSMIANIDEDAQATMDSYRVNNATQIQRNITVNGATDNALVFSSFSTNQFSINFTTTNSGGLFYYGWVVVADQFEEAVTEEQVYQSYGNLMQVFDSNKNAIFG